METTKTAKTTAPVTVGSQQMGKTLPAGSVVNVRFITTDGQFACVSDNYGKTGYINASALVY